ncbi:hypothetical protein [Nocardioides sp. YIM 152588]|uniref:hypothetical protein n=1 Tax=Nocardioides sp. YIM 152588 TaxID=3158259 RepID=UPI0032E39551
MPLTTGSRLKSSTSACEVVVVSVPTTDQPLLCGGEAMAVDAVAGQSAAAAGPQIALGKRYVDEGTGLEVLCVKPGAGPLTFGDTELVLKSAKPLPASD